MFKAMKKLLIIAAMGALVLTACKEEVKVRELIESTSITLDLDNLELPAGESVLLHATVLPEDAERPVRWVSNKPDVAIVSEEGAVKGIAPGEASIIAVAGKESALCHVLVFRPIEEFSFSDETVTILKNETYLLQPQNIVPDNATEVIKWSSDKPDIVTVDEDGLVKGVKEGEAVITAQCLKTSAQCTVVVSEVHAEAISISGPSEIMLGREATITVTLTPSNATDDIAWESSAPEIASVNNGVVKGLSYGEAAITASIGELSSTLTITVIEVPVDEIVISPSAIVLTEIGATVQAKATVLPEDAADKSFTWSIDDPTVASIDEDGNVTALAGGKTEIHATATNGVIGSATVIVSAPYSVPYFEDFEDQELVANDWSSIDADGDGHNWYLFSNEGITSGLHEVHSGYCVMISASYDNDGDGALTPDNWLISPPIKLNSASNYLSFWVCGQDAGYAKEHYAAYVTTDPSFSESSWTKILEGTVTQGYSPASYQPLAASTYENIVGKVPEAFNGQLVFFAIRHFNVTDEFLLNLDDFSVTVEDPNSSTDPTPEPTFYRAPVRNLSGDKVRKIVR